MKTKILALLTVFALLAPTIAMAANTFTVNYNVQVTGFTVEITANVAGVPETAMNFTGTIGSTDLRPSGTNNGAVRWGNITNTGELPLNFNITAPTNLGIELRVASVGDMSDGVIVDVTPKSPNGWNGVASGDHKDIFARADFNTGAAKGSTVVTIGSAPAP